MSSTIKTYADLCAERDRIKNELALQRQRVIDNWHLVNEELDPVKNAFGVIGKMAKPDKSNPIISATLKIASDLFLKNFVLAKAGWMTKLAVPFVMRNYSSHLIADKGKNILHRVAKFFSKKKDTTA